MKRILPLSLAAMAALGAAAVDYVWFQQGLSKLGVAVEATDSISLSADGTQILVTTLDGATTPIGRDATDKMTIAATDLTEVLIEYTAEGVMVTNPYAFAGVSVTALGSDVVINADTADEIVYRLSGTSAVGSLKVYSTFKLELLLDNLTLTNPKGPAINIQTGKKTTLRVPDGTVSTLTDGATYAASSEDQKGTLFSEGQIEFRGKGTLNITGNNKHALCSDDYIQLRNTTINVLAAKSDGIHVNDYFEMESGNLSIKNIGGDGIDADDAGYVTIQDGTVVIDVTGNSRKGIKTGVNGALTVMGGNVTVTTSGNVVVESGDPSYCTALKSGGRFIMSAGSVSVKATGTAGKGIKSDGNLEITGGNVDIEVTGAGNTYTNASNTTDSYSSTCISVDSVATITGGTFTLNTGSAATGGKCIKVDGDAIIGAKDCDLTITATTKGARFSVGSSSGSSWGGGGRPGQGGMGSSGSYSNPKVIKAQGNLTVNGGHLILTATNGEGGEALESKKILTINDGIVEASTVDDGLNAATKLVINGGYIFSNASNNDGIDSNGTILMTGGVMITMGASSPECGIDCDSNSNFTLQGGTFVAVGGSNNTPGASATTQRTATYSAKPNSAVYTFVDASGNLLLSFNCPRTYSSSMQMMITAPALTSKGASVKVYTGCTLSGGEDFHGLILGGSYSGGSQASTVTTN